MDRAHFVIISEARTGSNLLMYAIADHPEVICYGECFSEHSNQHYQTHIDSSPGAWHHVRGGIHHQYLPEFDIDTPAHTVLTEYIFRDDYPAHTRAVGFKYHWFQGRPASPWSKTRDLMREKSDLRVIHLHRENLLEQITSARLAQATKQWVVWNENDVASPTTQIILPLNHVHGFFADQTRNLQMIADQFRSHAYLRLSYEQLVADLPGCYEQVQEFLGLTIHPPPRPRTQKQSRRTMQNTIANYEELRIAFAGTPWARFFVGDSSGSVSKVEVRSQQ